MKAAIAFAAAAAALTFAAESAEAQTRTRARAAAQAPLPPAPYRLVGPGSAEAAATSDAALAGAEQEAQPRATPATPATRAAPAEGRGAAPATPAEPATPATPAQPDATEADAEDEAEEADGGADSLERARARAALTRVINELRTGNVDYTRMSEAVATRVRTQQPALTPALTQYGAVRSMTPVGAAGADGSERFRVTFASGEATWTINTDAEGKITNLGVE